MGNKKLPLQVMVVDDHRLFRQGLISLMETRPQIVEVIGEAEDGQQALEMARALRPDLILMDIYMPRMDGIQAAEIIRAEMPDTAIVILTSSEADEHLFATIRLGVSGYLLKNLDAKELFELLCGIAHGEAAITRALAARLLKNAANPPAISEDVINKLTEREIEVLRLIAQGASNPQIADVLFITVNTVKTHLRNILVKLNLENRTQVAAFAVHKKLAGMPEIREWPCGV
jgi:NarL family two-component system response regulator LiaR